MAESSNEHPAGATPDPAPTDSPPGDGPSEEEKTLALLSQPRRDVLTRVAAGGEKVGGAEHTPNSKECDDSGERYHSPI